MVDKDSRALVTALPEAFMQQCRQAKPKQIVNEFLVAQVELVSKPCQTISELAEEQKQLRETLVTIADEFGMAPIAASTHPFSQWYEQVPNSIPRYQRLQDELQITARRMLIAGMHLHIGIHDEEKRIHLLNRLYWYLPFMLSLSTSSPFWSGRDTGLNSYRLNVLDGLPRSGDPVQFVDYAEYNEYVQELVHVGLIDDASEIWWDLRLNQRFPTIELRITDVCPRLKDAVAIAAFYTCLSHCLLNSSLEHNRLAPAKEVLFARENRWVSQRHNLNDAKFLPRDKTELVTAQEFFSELLDHFKPYAVQFECYEYLEGVSDILENGSSAEQQRKIYKQAITDGADQHEALVAVVDHLIRETREF